MSARGRLLVASIFAVLTVPCAMASPEPSSIVHKSQRNWSMRLPPGWERYPDDVLRAYEDRTAEATGLTVIRFEAGYGPTGAARFSVPYLLVRSIAERQSPSVFDRVGPDLVQSATSDKLDDAASRVGITMDVGVTRRIPKKDAIVTTIALTSGDGEKLKAVALAFAGRDALVYVNFYLPDSGLDAGLPLVADAVESFAFEPGFRLRDPDRTDPDDSDGRRASPSASGPPGEVANSEHSDRFRSAGHWSIAIPSTWKQLPAKSVEQLVESTSRLTGKPRRDYEAMFGRSDRAPLAAPWVAISSLPLGLERPEAVLAELTGSAFEAALGESAADAARNLTERTAATRRPGVAITAKPGQVQRLIGLPGVLTRTAQVVPGRTPFTYLMATIVGRTDVAFLHFSVDDAEFESEVAAFKTMLDSFRFDPGFGIYDKPTPGTSLESVDADLVRRLGASNPKSHEEITDQDVARRLGSEPPVRSNDRRSEPDGPRARTGSAPDGSRGTSDWLWKAMGVGLAWVLWTAFRRQRSRRDGPPPADSGDVP